MTPTLLALALALLAAPPVEVREPLPEPARLVAAGWCSAQADDEDDAPGCDLGVGAALWSRGRLSVVIGLGAETIGSGFAWKLGEVAGRPVAISAGVVARWDEQSGIDSSRIYPVLGATVTLGGWR